MLTDPAAQRIEDRQTLSHQAGCDLPEAVGAVEDGQIGARKTLSGLLDDLRKLVDQHAVQRDPVVPNVRPRPGISVFSASATARMRTRSASASNGLTTSETRLLLSEFGGALRQFGSHLEHFALRLRLGQRSRRAGLGLSLVDFGLVLRLHDRRLPSKLGLVAL